jgi:hypothetical protein
MKRFVIILSLLACTLILSAQKPSYALKSDCYFRLRKAEAEYKAGLFINCVKTLEQVLDTCTFFSKKEMENVLELLAKSYLETGEQDKAESIVKLMLIRHPHYELREAENTEDYNRLVKKFKIHPLLTIGARNTADWVNYKTSKVYKVLDGLDYSEPYKKYKYGILSGFGFMYYGTAEIEFNHNISLNGDLTFWWTRFQRYINKAPSFNLNFWETDNYMEIPIYVKRYFPLGNNVLPYITAGIGWQYMTKASGNATISYTKDDVVTGKNIDFESEVDEMDMLKMRTRNTFEWIAGAGIGYKLKNLRLFLDVRYYGGLNSFTNPKKGLENSMLINDYFYVDNSVKLNQFEIGVSISYTLFNSIKKSKN